MLRLCTACRRYRPTDWANDLWNLYKLQPTIQFQSPVVVVRVHISSYFHRFASLSVALGPHASVSLCRTINPAAEGPILYVLHTRCCAGTRSPTYFPCRRREYIYGSVWQPSVGLFLALSVRCTVHSYSHALLWLCHSRAMNAMGKNE